MKVYGTFSAKITGGAFLFYTVKYYRLRAANFVARRRIFCVIFSPETQIASVYVQRVFENAQFHTSGSE